MRPLPHQPPAHASESADERVHKLEERIDRLTSELEAVRELAEHPSLHGSFASPSSKTSVTQLLDHRDDDTSRRFASWIRKRVWRGASEPAHRGDDRSLARDHRKVRRFEFEAWLGYYGAIALAWLTILLGIGAFLSWAILSGHGGPWARVALGALGAASLAGVGWHVHRHSAERYGSVLMALALAIFHVDVWGAGPHLHLVTNTLALATAGVASAALAWLALREREQMLFNVGFGGALIAPFVMSVVLTTQDAWWLLGYALIVLTAGLVSIHGTRWQNPPWVFVIASWGYIAWTTEATYGADIWFALAPSVFAISCACLALALLRGPISARIALAVLTVATIFIAGRVFDGGQEKGYTAVAAAIALCAFVATRRDPEIRRTLFLGAFLIPASTLWLALVPLESSGTGARSLVAILWTAMSVAFTAQLPAVARNVGFATAALCAGAVWPIVFADRSLALTLALSVYGAACSVLMFPLRTPGIAVGVAVWLTVAAVIGYGELADRVPYQYTPFMTWPSLGGLAYSLAWLVTHYVLRSLTDRPPDLRLTADRLVVIATLIAALSWGRQELTGAFSHDAAVLALIVYYALAGVGLIFAGRVRSSANLRVAGLVLSIYASFKSVFEASQLAVGFRVSGFLLSGLFLLGVAYWYQRAATGALIERRP